MTTDEKKRLAEEIEGQLVGVTPSEWTKWANYVARHGLQRALQFARVMQNSPSLRPGPRQAYRAIAEVVGRYQNQLSRLSRPDVEEVFGYVRWSLVGRGAAYDEGARG